MTMKGKDSKSIWKMMMIKETTMENLKSILKKSMKMMTLIYYMPS